KKRLEAMVDHPILSTHIPLVRMLGTQVVSSDESEDEAQRTINYPCVYPCWRSRGLVALMWHTDVAAEANTKIPLGTRKKAGTQLQSRPHTDKFNDLAAAPRGLPQNCYDEEWLSKLLLRTRKDLSIRGSMYDF
ncbi:hypothetical protein BDN67DRAFT_872676, partial [Paxillus ammoniavirescens]